MKICQNCHMGCKHGMSNFCLNCRIFERRNGELPSKKRLLMEQTMVYLPPCFLIIVSIQLMLTVFE